MPASCYNFDKYISTYNISAESDITENHITCDISYDLPNLFHLD